MGPKLTRQQFLVTGLALAPTVAMAQDSGPHALRYTAATIGAVDVEGLANLYGQLFGYTIAEMGVVDPALAASWGAPNTAGRAFANLRPASGEDVFLRIVAIDPVPGFKAATTLGWTSIEFVTDDPDKIAATLRDTPFRVIGPPAQLASFPTIRATQVLGPEQEVVHFTSETGDHATSPLPPPPENGGVGRIFIVVLAVPDVAAANDWYATMFNMTKTPVRRGPISIVNQSQGLAADHPADATFIRMAEQGNPLEFWGFDGAAAVPRPRSEGQLPPGVSMTSLMVKNLDTFENARWIAPPSRFPGAVYGGRRAATLVGPAGELLELIES